MKHKKIKNIKAIKSIVARLKKQRQKVVFTNGCFDILHIGDVVSSRFFDPWIPVHKALLVCGFTKKIDHAQTELMCDLLQGTDGRLGQVSFHLAEEALGKPGPL